MIYRQQPVQKKNNRLVFILIFLIIAGIIAVSVWFLQRRTVTTPHAAASTTVAFIAPAQTIMSGQQVSSSITVDPGNNQVSVVKLVLTYDNTQLQISSATNSLLPNASAFPQTLQPPATTCSGTQCTLTATFSIGSDPTKAIQTKTTLATFTATVIAQPQTTVTVGYESPTAVYSIASADQAAQNILASTVPLTFTVGGSSNVCQQNKSTCSWDALANVTTYHYKVTDTTSETTVQEGDVNAPQTTVLFPSQAGKTYSCNVTAANECGSGTAGSGESTCPLPSLTPSVTPTICVGPGTVPNLHIVCPNCSSQ
jgi:hypothetical protein